MKLMQAKNINGKLTNEMVENNHERAAKQKLKIK